MKKIKLTLTEKQVRAILTCLFEYSILEGELETTTGEALRKYYLAVLASIRKQVAKQ